MKLNGFVGILAVLLCMVMTTGADAEDSKLFDDLDAIMAEDGKKTEPADLVPGGSTVGVFLQLFEHSHVEATGRYAHFNENKGGPDDDTGELSLAFNTWTGQDHWRLHASGWLEAGTQEEMYAGVSHFLRDEDRRRRYFELNEIYTTFNQGNLDVTLGRRVMPRDMALVYQPSYVYHPIDLNVPVEPRTFGLWQISADYALGDSLLTAAVLPVFQDPKVPSVTSRWMPFRNALENEVEELWLQGKFFKDLVIDDLESLILYYYWRIFRDDAVLKRLLGTKTLEVQNDLPGGSLDEFGYLAKFKTSAGFVDLYGSYFFGPSEFPLIRVEERSDTVALIKENPVVHKVGGGAATTWGNFTFHGDGVFSLSPDDKDDSFFRYVAGVGYTAPRVAAALKMQRLDIMVDYAGESITSHQDAPGYFFSSEIIRPFKDDLVVRLLLGITEDLKAMYVTDQDLGYDSQYHRVGFSYRLYSGLVSEIYMEMFDGDYASYVGQWRDNDRVVVLLRWTL